MSKWCFKQRLAEIQQGAECYMIKILHNVLYNTLEVAIDISNTQSTISRHENEEKNDSGSLRTVIQCTVVPME